MITIYIHINRIFDKLGYFIKDDSHKIILLAYCDDIFRTCIGDGYVNNAFIIGNKAIYTSEPKIVGNEYHYHAIHVDGINTLRKINPYIIVIGKDSYVVNPLNIMTAGEYSRRSNDKKI